LLGRKITAGHVGMEGGGELALDVLQVVYLRS
jgi:hypothetical protein